MEAIECVVYILEATNEYIITHSLICSLRERYLLTRHSAYGKVRIIIQMFLNYLPLLAYSKHRFWETVKTKQTKERKEKEKESGKEGARRGGEGRAKEKGRRRKKGYTTHYAKCEHLKVTSCLHEEVWAGSGSLN